MRRKSSVGKRHNTGEQVIEEDQTPFLLEMEKIGLMGKILY